MAVDAYRKALALGPSLTHIRPQHGDMLKESGKLGLAVEAYQQAADGEPAEEEIRVHLARTFKRLGRIGKAIAVFRHALTLDPSDRESAGETSHLSQLQDSPPRL